jgi:hypothetical protein
MKMNEYTHHLDSKISRSESLFLAHFGTPPVSGAKEIDRFSKKSLYYNTPGLLVPVTLLLL